MSLVINFAQFCFVLLQILPPREMHFLMEARAWGNLLVLAPGGLLAKFLTFIQAAQIQLPSRELRSHYKTPLTTVSLRSQWALIDSVFCWDNSSLNKRVIQRRLRRRNWTGEKAVFEIKYLLLILTPTLWFNSAGHCQREDHVHKRGFPQHPQKFWPKTASRWRLLE